MTTDRFIGSPVPEDFEDEDAIFFKPRKRFYYATSRPPAGEEGPPLLDEVSITRNFSQEARTPTPRMRPTSPPGLTGATGMFAYGQEGQPATETRRNILAPRDTRDIFQKGLDSFPSLLRAVAPKTLSPNSLASRFILDMLGGFVTPTGPEYYETTDKLFGKVPISGPAKLVLDVGGVSTFTPVPGAVARAVLATSARQGGRVAGQAFRAPAFALLGAVPTGGGGERIPPSLPKELAGAKPNYSYGKKPFTLEFANDIDRAAYITAQKKPSPRDADYLKFVMDATGLDAESVREMGRGIRASIKEQAKVAAPGTLKVARSGESGLLEKGVEGISPGAKSAAATGEVQPPAVPAGQARAPQDIGAEPPPFADLGGVPSPPRAPRPLKPPPSPGTDMPPIPPGADERAEAAFLAYARNPTDAENKLQRLVSERKASGEYIPTTGRRQPPGFTGVTAGEPLPEGAKRLRDLPNPPGNIGVIGPGPGGEVARNVPPKTPSGRRPGGPGNIVPKPPRDPSEQWKAANNPKDEPWYNDLVNKLARKFYDPSYGLRKLPEVAGELPRHLFHLVPGAVGAGQEVFRRFYKPVLGPVWRDRDYLKRYMSAKSAEDTLQLHPGTLLPGDIKGWADIDVILKDIEKKLGPERYQQMQQVAESLWNLNDEHRMRELYKGGLISKEEYLRESAANPHYYPYGRDDFETRASQSLAAPGSVSDVGQRARSVEGSIKDLRKDAFERFLAGPIRTQTLIARNNAARTIVRSLERLQADTGEELVRYVEGKRELKAVERVTGEKKVFAKKGEHSKVKETISFFENGDKYTVEVPAEYGRIAKALYNERDMPFIVRLPAQVFRAGAISLNVAAMPALHARDIATAAFQEGLTPFGRDYWRAVRSVITKDESYSEAAQAKVFISGITEEMLSKKASSQAPRLGAFQVDSINDLLLSPIRKLLEIQQALERASRVAVYQKLRVKGLSEIEAAVRARDATVDFSKMGTTMRVVNQLVPFSNAALQGSVNMARTIRDNPVRALAMGTTLFVTPTVLARVNNMRYETSKDIPDYEYTRNWVVQFGEGTQKDGTKFPLYLKIPKGEVGGIFSFAAEALFSYVARTGDRSAAEMLFDYGKAAALQMAPVDLPILRGGSPMQTALSVVPAIGTAASLFANKDTYTGIPIVPRAQEGLRPEQQTGTDPSATAEILGKRSRISPAKIDYAIRDFFGGVGESSNWLLSFFLEAAGYDKEGAYGEAVQEDQPELAERIAGRPGVRRYFGARGNQEEREGWESFDKTKDATNRAFSKLPEMDAIGVSLGEIRGTVNLLAGHSETGIELTPRQRAEYQALFGAIAVEKAQTVAYPTEPKLRREAVRGTLEWARAEAERRFVASLPRPEDPVMSLAWDTEKALRKADWDNLYLKVEEISKDEAVRDFYESYRDAIKGGTLTEWLKKYDDPEKARRKGVQLQREVTKQERVVRLVDEDLDWGMVRFYGHAPVTVQAQRKLYDMLDEPMKLTALIEGPGERLTRDNFLRLDKAGYTMESLARATPAEIAKALLKVTPPGAARTTQAHIAQAKWIEQAQLLIAQEATQ